MSIFSLPTVCPTMLAFKRMQEKYEVCGPYSQEAFYLVGEKINGLRTKIEETNSTM